MLKCFMQSIFKGWSVITKYQCMNVKIKWHRCIPKFIYSFFRV